jgi:hypothetical protein
VSGAGSGADRGEGRSPAAKGGRRKPPLARGRPRCDAGRRPANGGRGSPCQARWQGECRGRGRRGCVCTTVSRPPGEAVKRGGDPSRGRVDL